MNNGKRTRKATSPSPSSGPRNTESQQTLFHEPLEKDEGKERYTGRLLVRIESIRKRLLDKDNLYGGGKFFCDFLRYCGAIPDDTEKDIDLIVTQKKVQKGQKEVTIIEVWRDAPKPLNESPVTLSE
jgi:hypothetical protein